MPTTPELMTLAQWARGTDWRLGLMHSAERHALIWITKGQGRCIIEGRRRGLTAHNALVIPAQTLFSLEMGMQGYGQVCLIPPGGPVLMPDTPQLLRIMDVHSQVEVTGIIEAMQRERNAGRLFNDEAVMAYTQLLTVWLRRMLLDHDNQIQEPRAAGRLVMAYCALVERDYATGAPMADYAGKLGVTPTHLTRVCRETCGLTASDILTQRTLWAARDMLERGQDSVKAVAAQLGFSSAAYFSRFIQHHTGKTPSTLRRAAA